VGTEDEDIIRQKIIEEDMREKLHESQQEMLVIAREILKRFDEERKRYKKSWRYRIFGRFFPTFIVSVE
jgi:hypothetical protein